MTKQPSSKINTPMEIVAAMQTNQVKAAFIGNDKFVVQFEKSPNMAVNVRQVPQSIEMLIKSLRTSFYRGYRKLLATNYSLFNIDTVKETSPGIWLIRTYNETGGRVTKLFLGTRVELDSSIARAKLQQQENHVMFLVALKGMELSPPNDTCQQRIKVAGVEIDFYPKSNPDIYASVKHGNRVFNFNNYEHLVYRFSEKFLR